MSDARSTKGYSFEALSHAVIGACIDVQRQPGVHSRTTHWGASFRKRHKRH
jgi:hypothetical protein